ncbi:serine hydroxymethyltransferase [Picrophilus oshimae]|uniref:Serine hydroxymethyltransferase n=1 Tax=Picrophilus torridus (strain ATCC 700027 / DSM 9790 / JCM 10055 / NBRC 100828 / KAW 2/3) TaxID=1122961 RepID=Q6L0Q9_PICTO|nr:serine hydroxymethyltransferase [Picrophilus oshimae]AAT43443.1 serine hydroxymethyltransferase [Picrophilus oshimae DSM 9789]
MILDLIKKNDEYRASFIPMQASENILSPNVRTALSSDLASRYSLDFNGDDGYAGNKYFHEILDNIYKNVSDLFSAKFCDPRPLSGHIAASVSLYSLMENRKVMAVHEDNGGYPGYVALQNLLNYNLISIPVKSGSIDYDAMEKIARSERPSVIILGQSEFTMPYDIKRVYDLSREIDSRIIYDASHVLGLIAGRRFQPGALRYSDVLLGSTHKTFFGPQGGIILTNNDEIYKKIEKNIMFKFMDNYNLSRFAALGVAVEEMLRYGIEYASKVIENSKKLREYMNEGPFNIPETESHQLLLNINDLKAKDYDFKSFSYSMERAGILIDRVGRIGLQEITRLGYDDMYKISEIFYSVYNKINMGISIKDIVRQFKIMYW